MNFTELPKIYLGFHRFKSLIVGNVNLNILSYCHLIFIKSSISPGKNRLDQQNRVVSIENLQISVKNLEHKTWIPPFLVPPRRRVKQNAVFRKIQGVRQLRGRGFSARIFWDPKRQRFEFELDDGEVSWHRENSTKQLIKQEKTSERNELSKAQRWLNIEFPLNIWMVEKSIYKWATKKVRPYFPWNPCCLIGMLISWCMN